VAPDWLMAALTAAAEAGAWAWGALLEVLGAPLVRGPHMNAYLKLAEGAFGSRAPAVRAARAPATSERASPLVAGST
jgi:hypothetical protein